MLYSEQDLIRLSSRTTYDRGINYYADGLVTLEIKPDDCVEAVVHSSTGYDEYYVQLDYSNNWGNLEYANCDCPAYIKYTGYCKHIIATILALQDWLTAYKPKPKRSDNTAIFLLNKYIQEAVDEASSRSGGQARLEPVLECDYNVLTLSFRIGEKRMYVVNDIHTLQSRFSSRDNAQYGKNFTLWHSPAAFDEGSQSIISFVERYYNSNDTSVHKNIRLSFYGQRSRRNMYISPSAADALFQPLIGRGIVFKNANKKEKLIYVVEEDYRPVINITKTDAGAILELQHEFMLLWGNERLYIVGDKLYCCSMEFTTACGELLETFTGRPVTSVFFADKDISILLSTILPRVEPYVKLNIVGEFEEYQPVQLVAKVYLDSPEADSATARIKFCYGDKVVEPFLEKNPSVSHDIAGEIVVEDTLQKYFGSQIYDGGVLQIYEDDDAIYRLVTQGLDELVGIAEIYTTDAFRRIKLRPTSVVSFGVKVEAGLMQLDYTLENFDLTELPGLIASYRLAKKYHRMRDGSFMTLENNALAGLSELAEGLDLSDEQLVAGHAELSTSRALYLDSIVKVHEEIQIDRDQLYKRLLRDMNEVENADYTIPEALRGVLRNYQKTGFRWLKTIAACGFGGILADDMGLGKTLQVLTLLQSYIDEHRLLNSEDHLPSIVVCPSSLTLNWQSEAEKFTPGLSTLVVAGTAAERVELIAQHANCDLMVTSYDALKRDVKHYEDIKFEYIVLDEAQYIKNHSTQAAKSVKTLKGNVHFALTGTPVENSLAELWSIFDFLMPGYLFTYGCFKKKYESPIVKSGEKEASKRLSRLVAPFILRRMKKEVLRELPDKTETVLFSSMESAQRKTYVATMAKAKEELGVKAGFTGQDKIQILAALMRLRQICCDPSLVYENYDGESAKLDACMELVESCIQSGHRILLFSQFTSMLDIIEKKVFKKKHISFMRIDGSTPSKQRLKMVNEFNDGDASAFLISLKAGGTGLNLTGADTVIHYDPWWNLSAQNQATDRAHRIGQKRSVQVYKLIVKDTIEERILEMQQKKADLANAIISESGANPFERLSQQELMGLFEDGV